MKNIFCPKRGTVELKNIRDMLDEYIEAKDRDAVSRLISMGIKIDSNINIIEEELNKKSDEEFWKFVEDNKVLIMITYTLSKELCMIRYGN